MQRFSSQEASQAVLRALQTIAMANGVFDEAEKRLLQVAAWLYELEPPKAALPSISANELAKSLDPHEGSLVLQDCVLMALADQDASPEEWKVLEDYAKTLQVEEATLRAHYDHGVRLRTFAQLEQERRYIGEFLQELFERKGSAGLEAFFRKGGPQESPAVSWRYRQLGMLPEKTLGRTLYTYCRKNNFGLPGEVGGLPESLLWHDLLHALTGYGTDLLGEVMLAAFTAGVERKDPFPYLFLALLPAQEKPTLAGVQLAYARGQSATEGFIHHWDAWPEMALPLQEVQAKYGAL